MKVSALEAKDYLMPTDLALYAGAGSGKTYSLTLGALHWLSGVNAQRKAVDPERLWLVTFTEKAAHEMKERLEGWCRRLAEGEAVPEALLQNAQALQCALPDQAGWRTLASRASQVRVRTFHALALELSLRFAEAPIQLIDGSQAEAMLVAAADEVLTEALLAKADGALESLAEGWGYWGDMGLVQTVVGCVRLAAQKGEHIGQWRVSAPDADAVSRALDECDRAWAACDSPSVRESAYAAYASARAEYGQKPQGAALARSLNEVANFTKDRSAGWLKKSGGIPELKAALRGLAEAAAAAWHAEVAVGVQRVSERVAERLKLRMAALQSTDFDGLLEHAVQLLEGPAGDRIRGAADVLLVDEFQDTNWAQYRFVAGMVSQPEWAPRLMVVGDRKQSIYRFRGAVVSLFEKAAQSIVERGGELRRLDVSYRTHAGLLEPLNEVFFGLAQSGALVFERGVDDLRAASAASTDTVLPLAAIDSGEAPTSAEERAAFEAGLIAQFCADELSQGRRPGDIALLLRSGTRAEVYAEAIEARGIPVQRHAGARVASLTQLEMQALLDVVAAPEQVLPWLSLARAPWSGVTLDSLLERFAPRSIDSAQLWSAIEALPEPCALLRLARLVKNGLVGLPAEDGVAALTMAIGLDIQSSVELADDERLAVCQLMSDAARSFQGDIVTFARSYRCDGPMRSQGPAIDAVQLLSVHGAKGLEWPVVVLPELFSAGQGNRGRVVINEQGEFGVRLSGLDYFARAKEIDAADGAERRSETSRLLYVAMTRAKSALLLGSGVGAQSGSFGALLRDAGGAIPVWRPAEGSSKPVAAHSAPSSPGAPIAPEKTRGLSAALLEAGSGSGEALQHWPATRFGAPREAAPAQAQQPGVFKHGHALELGQAIHAFLELEPWRVGGDWVTQFSAMSRWLPEAASAEGQEMVGQAQKTELFGALAKGEFEVAGTEVPFYLRSGAISVAGQIDIVLKGQGEWVVVDYKTGLIGRQSIDKAKAQLMVYAGALLESLPELEALQCVALYLRKGLEERFRVSRDDWQVWFRAQSSK